MAHDVFISYSKNDKPTADAVCAKLEEAHIRCWIAPRDIFPGADWGESIIDAIVSSRAMVLVFSAHVNVSRQVKREVERAVHHGISIIPLRIEDVQPSRSLEFFLSMPHWLDAFTPPLDRHLQYLVTVLQRLLAGPAQAPAPAEKTAADNALAEPAADVQTTPGPPAQALVTEAMAAASGLSPATEPKVTPPPDKSEAAEPPNVGPEQPGLLAKRRGRGLWIAFGASAFVVLAVAVLWALRSPSPASVTPAAVTAIQQTQQTSQPPTPATPPSPPAPSVQNLDNQADAADNQKNYQQAFNLYSQAAAEGDETAEFYLGELYRTGEGVTQDYGQALSWYQKAAAQGALQAELRIGVMYENGWGVKQDDVLARDWITKASRGGDRFAKDWLETHPASPPMPATPPSALVPSAQDLDKQAHVAFKQNNVQQAFSLYSQAADQGDADAEEHLGELYYFGEGVKQDYGQALDWYQKAAAKGNAFAEALIGAMYENGYGVTKDYGQALNWYLRGAAQGDSGSELRLGYMYFNGEGVKQDCGQALSWFQKAAAQGNDFADSQLADMYLSGTCVKKDDAQGQYWRTKSFKDLLTNFHDDLK